MKNMMTAAVLAAALLAAPVRASCWNSEYVAAAKVRDLQTKLMVAALRCRVAGADMLKDYNAFVVANRVAIGAVNDRLKERFFAENGRAGGQREYDRFTTRLANAYGAGASGPSACADMAALAREAQGADAPGLARIAEREGLAPALPGSVCPIEVASIADRR